MNFDQLEYFLSCASCLNFSLAAKYHFVSVSTISRKISALEQELGVKLFNRGYHGHTLTREGKRFYNFAENVLSNESDFWESIGRLGTATPKERQQLRIACYPFDNMFGRVVETISGFPTDWLGKTYRVYFIKPGDMPESVRRGSMHIGIDSAPNLAAYGRNFSSRLFFRSAYKLVVGPHNPLADAGEISARDILNQHIEIEDCIPDIFELDDKTISSPADIRRLGEHITTQIPLLLPRLRSVDFEKHILILPERLQLPALRGMRNITIKSDDIFIDYLMFWSKENTDTDVKKLVEMLEYFK